MALKFALIALVCNVFVGHWPCDAANILLVSFLNTSHFAQLDGVARPLVARNHTVYALFDEHTSLPNSSPYTLVTHRTTTGAAIILARNAEEQKDFFEKSQTGGEVPFVARIIKEQCLSIFTDELLFSKLRSLKLDLVIIDNFYSPCFALVPHKLGLPFVSVGTVSRPTDLRLPVLPSLVSPLFGMEQFGVAVCDESRQQWHIVRSFCRLAAFVFAEYSFNSVEEEYLHEFVDFKTTQDVRRNVSLAIVNAHYLLVNFLPKLPHVEYIAGLTVRPGKPLDSTLDKWVSEASNVVVVSFGSNFGSLRESIAAELLEAFGRLPSYRFLYRYDRAEAAKLNVPSNVLIMDWLPQNDVLAHKNTRLFVTHSGNNGQLEALYHGVPMLCFYIHADQKSNAQRVVQKGYGKMLNIFEFTADQLEAYLIELLSNNEYSDKIKKASIIFQSEQHPSERAADAVEHVLKHGGEHLRPKDAYELTWWQFYMLDVLAVLYIAITLTLIGVLKLVYSLVALALRLTFKQKRKTD